MIQITHLGRRTSWSKDDWLPVIAPSHVREPAHRAFPKAMEDWDIARVIAAYADAAERVQGRRPRWLRIRVLRPSHRPVLVAGDQQARRRIWRRRSTTACASASRCCAAVRERVGPDFIVGARMVCDEDWERGLSRDEGLAIARRLTGSGLIDFLNVIRGHIDTEEALSPRHPRHGRALGAASRFRRRSARRDAAADLPRRPHPGRRDRAPRDRERQARHGRHDPRAYRRPAYRAQDRGGPRSTRSAPASAWAIASTRSMPARRVCIHNPATGREADDAACRRRAPTGRSERSSSSARGRPGWRRRGSRASAGTRSSCSRRPPSRAARSCSPPRSSAGARSWASSTGGSRECERHGVAIALSTLFAEADDVLALTIRTSSSSRPAACPNLEFLDAGGESRDDELGHPLRRREARRRGDRLRRQRRPSRHQRRRVRRRAGREARDRHAGAHRSRPTSAAPAFRPISAPLELAPTPSDAQSAAGAHRARGQSARRRPSSTNTASGGSRRTADQIVVEHGAMPRRTTSISR